MNKKKSKSKHEEEIWNNGEKSKLNYSRRIDEMNEWLKGNKMEILGQKKFEDEVSGQTITGFIDL